jgi:hypothetical protein
VGRGRWWGKRVKKCVHLYVNAKMISVEIIPGIRGEER